MDTPTKSVKALLPVALLMTLLLGGISMPSTAGGDPEDACVGCCDECNVWAAYMGQQCFPGYFEPIECEVDPWIPEEGGEEVDHCEVICYYEPTKCTIQQVSGGCTDIIEN